MPPSDPRKKDLHAHASDVGSSHARASRRSEDSAPEAMAKTMQAVGGESGTHLARGTLLEGTYRVEALLGKGAMGAVYLVEHIALQKKFAAKVVSGSGMDAAAMARLRNEARMASAIDHEHIVRVTHLGTTDGGNVFVVMERLYGEDLRARTLRHREEAEAAGGDPWLSDREVRGIVGPLLSALDAAHTAGVVHRDLKPENIFLHERQGRLVPKIVDFGIGKLRSPDDSDVRLTATGQIVGTPLYMAPEQTRSTKLVDHRADLYAMGVMLFELLTGRLPFEASGVYEIVVKHVTEAPPDPRSFRPELPESISALVLRCLAKAPADRYQSAAELLAAWEEAWGLGPDVPSLPASGLARRSNPELDELPHRSSDEREPEARRPTPLNSSLAETSIPPPRPDEEAPPARPSPGGARWIAPAALAAVGLGVAVVLGLWLGDDPAPIAPDAPPVRVEAEPEAVEPEVVEAAPDPAPEPAPDPVAPPTRLVASTPSGAEVVHDGVVLGTTPLEVELPPEGVVHLELRRRGRETVARDIGPADPERVEVVLPPRRRPSVGGPGLAPQ